MFSPEHEQAILAEYEGLLEDAQRNVESAQREAETIAGIVTSLRARVALLGASKAGRRPQPRQDPVAAAQHEKRTLMSLLREIMADGNQRDTDQICDELRNVSDQQFSRSSVNNRLYDLASQGYLRRLDRGIYQRASDLGHDSNNGNSPRLQSAGTGVPLQTSSRKVDTSGGRSVG